MEPQQRLIRQGSRAVWSPASKPPLSKAVAELVRVQKVEPRRLYQTGFVCVGRGGFGFEVRCR